MSLNSHRVKTASKNRRAHQEDPSLHLPKSIVVGNVGVFPARFQALFQDPHCDVVSAADRALSWGPPPPWSLFFRPSSEHLTTDEGEVRVLLSWRSDARPGHGNDQRMRSDEWRLPAQQGRKTTDLGAWKSAVQPNCALKRGHRSCIALSAHITCSNRLQLVQPGARFWALVISLFALSTIHHPPHGLRGLVPLSPFGDSARLARGPATNQDETSMRLRSNVPRRTGHVPED